MVTSLERSRDTWRLCVEGRARRSWRVRKGFACKIVDLRLGEKQRSMLGNVSGVVNGDLPEGTRVVLSVKGGRTAE